MQDSISPFNVFNSFCKMFALAITALHTFHTVSAQWIIGGQSNCPLSIFNRSCKTSSLAITPWLIYTSSTSSFAPLFTTDSLPTPPFLSDPNSHRFTTADLYWRCKLLLLTCSSDPTLNVWLTWSHSYWIRSDEQWAIWGETFSQDPEWYFRAMLRHRGLLQRPTDTGPTWLTPSQPTGI